MRQWTAEAPYMEVQGVLLEGPLYNEGRDECRFVDIVDQKLYTFRPSDKSKSLKVVDTRELLSVTAFIDGSDSEMVVAARRGFAKLNTSTGEVEYIKRVWEDAADGAQKEKTMRFNDGAVDSRGRFWAGSMTDPEIVSTPRQEGCLYRMDPDLSVHAVLEPVYTPNGIGWNRSETVMYWTESVDRSIYAFDFDIESGALSNQRVFWNAQTAGLEDGVTPDGLVVDEEDCVWTALWRGSKVLRVNDRAETVGEVSLPTAYVTCPVFVGTGLVITTARDPAVMEAGVKRGGDVYRVDVGVKGLPKYSFKSIAPSPS